MPEDQPYNGSMWTKQMSKLLESFAWEFVGDSDIDVKNENDEDKGVDRIFKIKNPYHDRIEVCLLECKRYSEGSFSQGKIQEWVKVLDDKLSSVKHSDHLLSMFPVLENCSINSGLVSVWCIDLDKSKEFTEKIDKGLEKAFIPPKPSKSRNKIFVVSNETILKMCSLRQSVDEINRNANCKREFNFFYAADDAHAACRSKVLSPNYMLSKFVLGDFIDDNNSENKVVFLFGDLNLNAFYRLRSALSDIGYTDKDKPLHIYTYKRSDDFRKITPEVEKAFDDIKVNLKEMERFADLPGFLKK